MIKHQKLNICIVLFFLFPTVLNIIPSNYVLANTCNSSINITNRISYNSASETYYITDYTNKTSSYSKDDYQYFQDTWGYIGSNWQEHILPMFTNNELIHFINNKKYNNESNKETRHINNVIETSNHINDESFDRTLNKNSDKCTKAYKRNTNLQNKNIKANRVTNSDTVIIY